MRRLVHAFSLLLFGVALLSCIGLYVDDTKEVAYATPLFVVSSGVIPQVTAHAWLLFDIETGEAFAGERSGEPMPIASVSKLMTALVAYTGTDQSANTAISESAVATEGRAGRLKVGESIGVHELLFPLLLESSNDGAEALAEVGGDRSAFIAEMNARAESLGLTETSFEDPSGLSPSNISSAEDLARLASYLYEKNRHLLDVTTLTHYVGENHDWQNNDPMVGTEGYVGGKHGFTPEAGRTFAGIFTESLKGGSVRPIGIVLLNSDNIKTDVAILREFLRSEVEYTVRF